MRYPWQRPPVIEQHEGVLVVRDDLLPGGSKTRFLPALVKGAREVVFGGPFCGGAPVALSVVGRVLGIKITLFYAARREPHRRQRLVAENGARIHWVPFGYMSNVQAKARRYAEVAGALFLPLGFDVPAAEEPFVEAIAGVRRRVGDCDQVWCATGSGMLARCLALAFPSSAVHAVCVGLRSRWAKQLFPPNITLHPTPWDFSKEIWEPTPFPACANYERKAWRQLRTSGRGRMLFWNVLAA